jgi:hypothetical protein
MAEVGYNYLRTVGTADAPYFLNLFRTLFNDNYRDFIAAYPDVDGVFSSGIDTTEKLSRVLLTLLLWKMGYLRGVFDSEGYYTGRVLPGTNPRIRQVTEGASSAAEGARREAVRQKRLSNFRSLAQGLPARSDEDLAAWFRNASAVTTWQPTFRDLTPATAEAQLTASNAACEAASNTSLLPDAFDFGLDAVSAEPSVVSPVAPAAQAASSGANIGLAVAGAAFGWLVTRFFL